MTLRYLLILIAAPLLLAACHPVESWDNDTGGNFDALWSILDTHYCYFEEKGIDWDEVYSRYYPRAEKASGLGALYTICNEMLNELRDGHVNLTTPFATSYYKRWWSDYPQNYDQRLVEEYYLGFGGLTRGALTYSMLVPDSVAYVRYSTFSSTINDATLDWLMVMLSPCKAMIFDIRDNGGGDITNVQTLVQRFINSRILAGYISHKTGPGHSDFSEPYAYYYDPAPYPRVHWDKPVIILTNRSTFSAANNFVAVMRSLPGVTLVGDTTGGGSGMPFSSELPCGWSIRFSASPIYDAEMRVTEFGIEPDIHVDLDPELALQGIDTILETALSIARQGSICF